MKQLVTLFHKAGNCMSYDKSLKVDTTLAKDTITSLDENTGTVIPRNILPGKYNPVSVDNINIYNHSDDVKGMSQTT